MKRNQDYFDNRLSGILDRIKPRPSFGYHFDRFNLKLTSLRDVERIERARWRAETIAARAQREYSEYFTYVGQTFGECFVPAEPDTPGFNHHIDPTLPCDCSSKYSCATKKFAAEFTPPRKLIFSSRADGQLSYTCDDYFWCMASRRSRRPPALRSSF